MAVSARTKVGLLATGAFFGHAVYPLTVRSLARLTPREHAPTRVSAVDHRDPAVRFVSAVVPAYREVTTIGPLVEHLLHGEGSPIAEVVVVADDDEQTAAVAAAAGAVIVSGPGRHGKSSAVNRGVERATQDVVLLMDANVSVDLDAVRRLAEHVRDDRLDLAGGVRTEHGRVGESMYWTFENAMKTAEDRLGGSLAVVGELICLRRSLFRPIPTWVRVDDVFLAVDFASRRHRVSVDTSCVSTEHSASPREQLSRRFRLGGDFLEVLVRQPRPFLVPTRSLLMLHGHRTWRATAGPVCQALLVVHCLQRARRNPVAAGWAALNLFAVADYLGSGLADRAPNGRLRALLGQALGMPPVVLVGALRRLSGRLLSGSRDGTWVRVER